MLTDPSIEKLKEKSASPYDLTVLVSKRARELTDGAQREEKIRRREEAENRRKMLEEERAERMSVAGGLNSKGLDDLIDALAGGSSEGEEEEVVYEGDEEPETEDEE